MVYGAVTAGERRSACPNVTPRSSRELLQVAQRKCLLMATASSTVSSNALTLEDDLVAQ